MYSSMLLQVRNLTTKLKLNGKCHTVVDRLSFDLKEGETLALVGESGCGKSLTAYSLLRILPEPPALPPEGEALFKGIDLLTLPESRMRRIRGRQIAMVFQDPMTALNPVYTIGDQLLETASAHLNVEKEAAEKIVLNALEDVHLPNPRELMEAYPHQLSGGMLQRAMIAMALLCSPDLLIADEPTTALDVTIQAQILALLKELQEKKGMATLIITHDMGVVAELADEVIVMYAGKQIEEGSALDLFDNPAHPYTQGLFAARPDQGIRARTLPTIEGSVPRVEDLPKGCPFHPRCQYAMDVCRAHKAESFSLREKGHRTWCWLYDKELKWKLADEEAFES
ncbi:MAG: ABC transporter ATP-binding protein [Chlamydiales bacterium]|nr:ABC transporter ATP-binding protein [Chlamydiales bacterium]